MSGIPFINKTEARKRPARPWVLVQTGTTARALLLHLINEIKMEKQKFEMGLVQREWVASLERNGEIQAAGCLGKVCGADGKQGYTACCLGEFIVTEARVMGWNPPVHNGRIVSTGYDCDRYCSYPTTQHAKELGLVDRIGSFKTPVLIGGNKYRSLVGMNDDGVPWSEIARIIREDPANVFTHPY